MYKYVLNSVVKFSMMFAKYFEYYTIMLGGAFFVDTLWNILPVSYTCSVLGLSNLRMIGKGLDLIS